MTVESPVIWLRGGSVCDDEDFFADVAVYVLYENHMCIRDDGSKKQDNLWAKMTHMFETMKKE
jgi:hypothetical protein